jgi:hypothetical protein
MEKLIARNITGDGKHATKNIQNRTGGEVGMTEMDREKVIKGLEYCEEYFNCCDKCPYWDGGTHCAADLAHDALALLKEQDNEIDTLKTLLLGYETGAIKCNNDALTQEGR